MHGTCVKKHEEIRIDSRTLEKVAKMEKEKSNLTFWKLES